MRLLERTGLIRSVVEVAGMEWFRRLFGSPTQVGAERRRSYRVRFNIPCVLIIPPSEAVTCTLSDFSNHGMRLGLSRRIKPGTAVKVLLQGPPGRDGTLTLSAVLSWCRRQAPGFSAGLAYTAGELPAVMQEVSELVRSWREDVPSDLTQRRKTRRLRSACRLQYRIPGQGLRDGLTQDISDQRIRFSTTDRVDPGVTLEIFLLLKEHDPVLLLGEVTRSDTIKDGYDLTARIDSVVEDERRRLDGLLEQP